MDATEYTFTTQKTARYCTWGAPITQSKHIWFVCHGYGMLARYFVRKFTALDPTEDCIIVPEALQRFYLEGFSGKVGATWMTKEARLDDINDYVRYLDNLHIHLQLDKLKPEQVLIHFGFSQGVATMARYIALGKFKPNKAVFWAGTFPPDLEPQYAKEIFLKIPVFTALGDADPFANAGQLANNQKHFEASDIDPVHLSFEGGHDIYGSPLLHLKKIITQ